MTNPPADAINALDDVEVMQADRLAYLSLNMLPELDCVDMMAGRWDKTTGLQAFARHRIASTIPDAAALDAAEARGYERGLREAATEAKIGWVTANYDVVGIADADIAMRLCEHVEAAILAKLETKHG